MSKYSKQNYVEIASIFKGAYVELANAGDKEGKDFFVRTVVMPFVDLFGHDNPRFDVQRFMQACGVVE